MVQVRDALHTVEKVNDIILPSKFRTLYNFLHYLRHLYAYEVAKNKIRTGSKVLEIGFGEGYGAAHLSSANKNFNIFALDIDKTCILHAQSKYKSANVHFKLYNGESLPFKNSEFDAIISFQVIEHVKDDFNFLSEIYRVLKPNGMLIITSVNRFHRLRHGQKPWNVEHFREYYPHKLYTLLQSIFNHVELFGIEAIDEIQDLIIRNYNRRKKITFFSFYSDIIRLLRSIIPESAKQAIQSIRNTIKPKRVQQHASNENTTYLPVSVYHKYSFADFYLVKKNVIKSMDTLCVCIK